MAEERNASNTVIKRFFAQGEQVPGASSPDDKLFYTLDHLGSIRELVDDNEVVRGRWDYDPYGKRSDNLIVSNPLESSFGYTGHYQHPESNLTLAPFRPYNPDFGWLSRDPIAESGGINLYGYVGNNPANYFDPLGLYDFSASHGWFDFGSDFTSNAGVGISGAWNGLMGIVDAAGSFEGMYDPDSPACEAGQNVRNGVLIPFLVGGGISAANEDKEIIALILQLLTGELGPGDPTNEPPPDSPTPIIDPVEPPRNPFPPPYHGPWPNNP